MENVVCHQIPEGFIVVAYDYGYLYGRGVHDVQWNDVRHIYCFVIHKRIYNFLLRLYTLKFLCFKSGHDVYLVTYNSKFFKHKNIRSTQCVKSHTPIIFIL